MLPVLNNFMNNRLNWNLETANRPNFYCTPLAVPDVGIIWASYRA